MGAEEPPPPAPGSSRATAGRLRGFGASAAGIAIRVAAGILVGGGLD